MDVKVTVIWDVELARTRKGEQYLRGTIISCPENPVVVEARVATFQAKHFELRSQLTECEARLNVIAPALFDAQAMTVLRIAPKEEKQAVQSRRMAERLNQLNNPHPEI